jgi:hypothetical protein
MAKRATAKKAKAKAKTGTPAGTKVPMHIVVHFVRMLHDRKHAAKFIAHAKKSGVSITVSPKGVKAVNDFLQTRSLTTARTAAGIDDCPNADPFKCPDR